MKPIPINQLPVVLNEIKTSIALCSNVKEAKALRDKAEAVRSYAKAAELGLDIQNNAAEIKIRAERRAGELLVEMEKHKGAATRSHDVTASPPKLDDLGISKMQSSRWQQEARVPEDTFVRHVVETKEAGKEVTTNGILRLAQEERRQERINEMSTAEFPKGKYRVIYADPPWKYGSSGVITESDSYGRATRHYPSMSIDELCQLPVKEMVEDNAVLFMWVTSPLLAECFPVIKAWGFTYKASFVWDKIGHNFGHYVSVRHEFLLICTRGSCLPDTKELLDSVVSIKKSRKHSEKPDKFRQIINTLYPHGKRVELFAREQVEGWDFHGNEV